jgi:phenylacetate-CoA ligase
MEEIRDRWLAAIERHRHHPTAPANDRIWAPELEACSRDELRAIQSDKLVHAVAYMAARAPMYARKLAAAGIDPRDIRGVEDLTALPVVTKHDMSASVQDAPPWGEYTAVDDARWASDGWQVFQTSGTTAASRPFRYTQLDRELWAWADARAVYAMGVRRGRDVGMMLFGYGPHVAMWGLHHALLLMGVPQLAAGGLDTRTRARAIERMGPTVLGCTPSYALHLASVMHDMGIDPAATAVRIIVAMGEPTPPASAARIRELWGAEVHQFYGCTEAAPSCGGYTCAAGNLHFLEDTHILETLDPDTWQPVPDGQPGVSVVTNLISEASPQIRFVVGDYTTLSYEPCACGRTHVICQGGFSGRADDMLNIRGVTLFPSAIEQIIRSFDELGEEFKVVVEQRDDLDELTLVVEARDPAQEDALRDRLAGAFRAELELRPGIEFLPYGTLPKTEFKANRVEDRR